MTLSLFFNRDCSIKEAGQDKDRGSDENLSQIFLKTTKIGKLQADLRNTWDPGRV